MTYPGGGGTSAFLTDDEKKRYSGWAFTHVDRIEDGDYTRCDWCGEANDGRPWDEEVARHIECIPPEDRQPQPEEHPET